MPEKVVLRICVCGCGAVLTGRQLKYAAEECRKVGTRNSWLKKTYNITQAEYDTILAFQGGKCGICPKRPKPGEYFHVDHEHRGGPEGPVRGILCSYCNTRLVGRLKSHETAQALADYLRDPPATSALGREVIAPGRPRRRRTRTVRRRRSR